jgi:hypothetical protein
MNGPSKREILRTDAPCAPFPGVDPADYADSIAFICEGLTRAADMLAAAADLMGSPSPLDTRIAYDICRWAQEAISEALYEMKALPMRDGRDA